MKEWKRKWQDICFKNGFCTTLTGPEIEAATYTCRPVVHGGAGLLASKLAWNYINCMAVEMQSCLIVLWAGLVNSVSPHPSVRIVQPFSSLICFIPRHWVLLDTQSVTLDWWSANMHLPATRRHRTTRTDISSLREIRTRDLSVHAASFHAVIIPHWADEYWSNFQQRHNADTAVGICYGNQ